MKIYRIVRDARIYKIVKEMSIFKIILATLLIVGVVVWIYAGLLNIPLSGSERDLGLNGGNISNLGVTLNINFDNASDVVSASYTENLKSFATYLKNHPEQKVEIQGHTDSEMANLDTNLDLSYRRAYSVAKILIVKYSVPTDQIVVKGYGSLKPLVKNNSKDQLSMNRRIEAVLVK